MNTLAEGVETIGQVNILKNMGCSIAQGFYYSSPLSSEEFIKYVNKNA
jgi:sensor c-di-GMP phosphodiesterase-like protein